MKKLLLVHYGPGPTSVTDKVVLKLKPLLAESFEVSEVDLVTTHPIIFTKESMSAYVKRNYKGEELSDIELRELDIADKFSDQVIESDLLVMVFPMYNFTIPAVIKGWIDNITQAKKLFQYTEYGPVGLAKISNAIVIPVTGSTPANSSKDFLTPYVDFILKFIGVKNVVFKGIYGTRFLGDSVDLKIEEVSKEVIDYLKNYD